ncbi:pentapeptide repeat-containing protein [Maridesulfovibrio bastinii]|uniref:pentapeptide repeat-containing protein n=1 Tax=Maridesulfovibrio bastinii TaxID=47157 RepID=UPI00068605E4|nr:pentapeptide repeat-containing protein [Maridesulfovibrio bastinii]
MALFTIASNRYDRAVHTYEVQISNFQTQMASDYRAEACGDLARLQRIEVPVKPDVLNPKLTISSFFLTQKYLEGQKILISTILRYKSKLTHANLSNANLSEIDLREANLNCSNLSKANLSKTKLDDASLRFADLKDANLEGATLQRACLVGAKLNGANLKFAFLVSSDLRLANYAKANLAFAFLSKADLRREPPFFLNNSSEIYKKILLKQLPDEKSNALALSKVENLRNAKFSPKLEKELRKTHPELFVEPKGYKGNDN